MHKKRATMLLPAAALLLHAAAAAPPGPVPLACQPNDEQPMLPVSLPHCMAV